MRIGFVFVSGFLLFACGQNSDLPEHTSQLSELIDGNRVQIDVPADITREECIALIEAYRDDAEPDGQVSVHKFSQRMKLSAPWCVENFDGKGIRFNDEVFN